MYQQGTPPHSADGTQTKVNWRNIMTTFTQVLNEVKSEAILTAGETTELAGSVAVAAMKTGRLVVRSATVVTGSIIVAADLALEVMPRNVSEIAESLIAFMDETPVVDEDAEKKAKAAAKRKANAEAKKAAQAS